jgi:hypothetical protein
MEANPRKLDALLRAIETEYREMPGLAITLDQACRLWHANELTCRAALGTLVAAGSLVVSERGTYMRNPHPELCAVGG